MQRLMQAGSCTCYDNSAHTHRLRAAAAKPHLLQQMLPLLLVHQVSGTTLQQ
jgi:hypothetical protein